MYLALFILTAIPSICKGLDDECDVGPKDLYIEMGSDTEITCQTSCTRGKIFWTQDSKPLDENLSKTINSTHTVLSLRNFTQRSATVQCHRADTKQIVGGTIIKTYFKPSKISCVLHYNNQAIEGIPILFTCNWEHQVDPPLEINYTVLCGPKQIEICNSRETTCTSRYGAIDSTLPLFGESSVIVRAKTKDWEVSSDPYKFTTTNLLKIARPALNVTALSDHLLVEWKILSHITRKSHCQVKYRKAVDEETPEWVRNKTLENGNNKKGNMTIENVESCSNYTFTVRCALINTSWSDWSLEKTVLTKLKKIDVKLRLWRKVDEVEKNGVRRVRVMWTEIPSTCQDSFTYAVKQTPDEEHMTGANYTLCSSSVCDMNQNAHRIKLTVFEKELLFVEDSVYVPAIGESVPQVTDIHSSTLDGMILVSWKAPVQPVSGYMLDYTHNGNQYHWKETKYTNATLFDLLDKTPYNITVTPLFEDKTGHGTQALQICSRVGDPGDVTNIDVKAKDRSAFVSWKVTSQEACSGVVVNYTVFYRAENGTWIDDTVASTKQDILLKDLIPETEYRIFVKATALTGSTKSSETRFKTKRYDPSLSTTLSVSGGILIFLVFSLGLCCALRWKKFDEKPVPNPGNSSLASWLSTSHEKPSQFFHIPSESFCDRVDMEEASRTSTPPKAPSRNDKPAGDQTEICTNPAPHIQNEDPTEAVETQHPSSPGESTELLSPQNSPSSPYRTQSPVEIPALRPNKQSKPVKNTTQRMVYVTLDMFEQGQGL